MFYRLFLLLVFVFCLLLPWGMLAHATPTAVTRYVAPMGSDGANDCTNPNQPCASVVYAVQQTEAGDTVQIATGTYTETDVVYLLRDVTITGAGLVETRITVISGTEQVFLVYPNVTAAISQLSLYNAARNGISNLGFLTLNHLSILNNLGQVTGGGGIYNEGVLTMTNSLVSGNRSDTVAAGMINYGQATIRQSLFVGNEAGPTAYGGGLHNQGVLVLENVTLTLNKAGSGTAVSNGPSGIITLTHVTIAQNVRTAPGATSASAVTAYGPIHMRNTLVADNGPLGQCDGGPMFQSHGFNLESADSCAFNHPQDLIHTNPLLGTFAPVTGTPNWVSTLTLAAESPARDAVNPAYCLPTDARGVARPQGPACDIGAYEFNQYRVLLPLAMR